MAAHITSSDIAYIPSFGGKVVLAKERCHQYLMLVSDPFFLLFFCYIITSSCILGIWYGMVTRPSHFAVPASTPLTLGCSITQVIYPLLLVYICSSHIWYNVLARNGIKMFSNRDLQ